MPSLKAAPGRVVLKFPEPEEKTKSGIIIPDTSKMRPEFALVHDLGDPLSEDDVKLRYFFSECKKAGIRIAVSFASGISYWEDGRERNYDVRVWGWLKSYRIYRYNEIASVLVEDDKIAAAMKLETEAVAHV